MIRALIRRNLRHHRALLVSLFMGLVVLEVIIIRFAAAVEAGPGMGQLLDLLPDLARRFVNAKIRTLTFPVAAAFGFQHPVALAGCFAWVMVFGTLSVGEREAGLLEVLLARPVPRRCYLAAALVCMVLGAVLLPAALLTGSFIGLALVDGPGELPPLRYAPSAAALTTLLLAVGGFTLWMAAGARRRGVAIGRALGVILGLYFVDMLSLFWPAAAWTGWLSPFHYFAPIDAAVIPDTPIRNPLVLLSVFAATTAVAFARFSRRDI